MHVVAVLLAKYRQHEHLNNSGIPFKSGLAEHVDPESSSPSMCFLNRINRNSVFKGCTPQAAWSCWIEPVSKSFDSQAWLVKVFAIRSVSTNPTHQYFMAKRSQGGIESIRFWHVKCGSISTNKMQERLTTVSGLSRLPVTLRTRRWHVSNSPL